MKNIDLWNKLLADASPGCAMSYGDARGLYWNCGDKMTLVIESDEHGHLKMEIRSSIFEADTVKSEYLILDGKHVCELTPDRYDRVKEIIRGFWEQKAN